jgi:hypothetical protein
MGSMVYTKSKVEGRKRNAYAGIQASALVPSLLYLTLSSQGMRSGWSEGGDLTLV